MNYLNLQTDPLVEIARSILIEKSIASKRKAHFAKQSKMSDSDGAAYKPAPGDAAAETRPSQYTKAYAAKYGKESVDFVQDDAIDEAAQLAGLKNKSEKSKIAYDILKQVFDRGMAAWKTGHRPGAGQHQWAYARVNSFIMGGKTRTTADADLWAKHKEKSKSLDEETWEDGYARRVIRVTSDEHKKQGHLWRIKGKDDASKTIKYYKSKPDFKEFVKQMKRVAGHEFGR
jgi:hypothetical protein